jgi:hypothetical protein
MAAPVVESLANTTDNTGVSTVVMDKPSGTADGDLLFWVLATDGAGTTVTSYPSGWTQLVSRADGSAAPGARLIVAYKIAGGSEPSTYSFVLSATERCTRVIARISGVDTTNPINDSADAGTNTDSTHPAPSVTTTVADCLLLCMGATRNGDVFSAVPSGMTEEWIGVPDFITSSRSAGALASLALTSSGATGTKSFTTNDVFDSTALFSVALAPAGGGATEITTSGAPSIAAVTASGTAEVERTSSGAVTVGAVTVAGSGDVTAEVTGSGAVTTAATGVSGTAEREITGSGAVETGATTVSGTAERELTSSGAVTTGAAEADGTAEREITGSGAVDTPAVTVDGTATTGAVINATGAVTIAAVTASGTAEREETSTGAVTVPGTTISGSGAVERKSTGAVTTPAATVSGTAEREVTGSGAVTLPAVEVDGTAAAVAAGETSGNVIIAPIEVAGVAEREITGSGAITLPGIVAQGPQLDDEDTGGGGNHYSYDSEPILSEREYKALADAYMRTGRDDHPDKVSRQVRRAEARKNNSAEIPRTQQSIADFKPPKTSTAIGAIEALRRDIEYAKAERAQAQQVERVEAERQAQVERQRQQAEQLRLRRIQDDEAAILLLLAS